MAGTSASTACRARTTSPSASRTPRARPADTCTSVTGTPQRTCTPSDSARLRSAWASIPAPPSGTGNPTSWASITSSHPKRALPALSGETSLCIALPLNSTRASSLPNSSWPSRRTESRPSRVRSSVPETPERASSRIPDRTGGNGVNRASSSGSRTRSQPATIRSQASPSPVECSSSPAAVSDAVRRMTAQRPSGRAWATTSGACRHASPCSSRCRSRMTGLAAASG